MTCHLSSLNLERYYINHHLLKTQRLSSIKSSSPSKIHDRTDKKKPTDSCMPSYTATAEQSSGNSEYARHPLFPEPQTPESKFRFEYIARLPWRKSLFARGRNFPRNGVSPGFAPVSMHICYNYTLISSFGIHSGTKRQRGNG